MMTIDQFRAELRRLVKKAGSQEQLASSHGLTRQEIGRALTGIPPKRLLKALGLERHVTFSEKAPSSP